VSTETIKYLQVDTHFLLIHKPAGLLSVPGRSQSDCAINRVQQDYADALVVHRLDCATSGLLLLARGADAQRELSRQFHDREVHKTYLAQVAGPMPEDQGKIDAPMCCDWPQRPRQKIDWQLGKPAQTLWKTLKNGPDWSLLELTPITGRSHQLRLHLAHIGHPIWGDALYADPHTRARSARLLLHAQSLRFYHPATKEPVEQYCPAAFGNPAENSP
jgi:tRNA pseudouridine32 synthase / 23S rRNA pseudouridine746 synthase